MGEGLGFECPDEESMKKEMARHGLHPYLRYCNIDGCLAYLICLTGFEGDLGDVVDNETIRKMRECVKYFVDNGTMCPDEMIPAYAYEDTYHPRDRRRYSHIVDGDDDAGNIARLLLWFDIGISHGCTGRVW